MTLYVYDHITKQLLYSIEDVIDFTSDSITSTTGGFRGFAPNVAFATTADLVDDVRPNPEHEEIRKQLDALDAAAIRPLRSIQHAMVYNTTPDPIDIKKLADLDAQAFALRNKLRE